MEVGSELQLRSPMQRANRIVLLANLDHMVSQAQLALRLTRKISPSNDSTLWSTAGSLTGPLVKLFQAFFHVGKKRHIDTVAEFVSRLVVLLPGGRPFNQCSFVLWSPLNSHPTYIILDIAL